MNKITMMILSAAALFTTACSSSDELQQQTAQTGNGWSEYITVEAGTPGGADASAQGSRRVAVDPSNSQKSLWEEGDKLTIWTGDECTPDNMSENGFELISGAGTGTAKFSGSLESTSAPTSNTKLIAIIDKEDDEIYIDDGSYIEVNLTPQKYCTAESALDHELFYATSTYANRNFKFKHKMALIKWTIKVNGASDGDMCDIILSDKVNPDALTSVDYIDANTGNKKNFHDKGNITLKDVTLTSANSTDLYVVMAPGYSYTGIIATLTMTSGDKAGQKATGFLGLGKPITFEENKFYTAGNEFTPAPINDFTSLKPGDVIYADDGTTPIAVTVYQSGGHGFAIALEDCVENYNCSAPSDSGTPERNRFTWDVSNGSSCLGNKGSTFAEAIADMDGLGNTRTLLDDGDDHYAALAASIYEVDIPSDAPADAAWVLPSFGQWFQLIKTFAVSADDFDNGIQLNVTMTDFGQINGDNHPEYYTYINSNLKSKCTAFTNIEETDYWTSSEYSSHDALGIVFYTYISTPKYDKTDCSLVRAFLQF